MNNKKIKFTLLSILVLAIVCISMMVGCDGDTPDTPPSDTAEIFIEKNLLPRTVYVEGQELDLTNGALTVVKDGEQTRVPLTDASITIEGYDKNKLGNQTLTISYNGNTTTFTVGVIARMVVENAELSYFTGELFNTEKGKVKIANDNAETSYVNMSSELISVKSFDSSVAGTTAVTIEYRDGDKTYECSFDVEVYEPDTIEFKAPKTTEYLSHQKELNLTGGYLYIKAKAPSTFSKSISLTANMTTGYEPDKVSKANKGNPVDQTVTVSYAGREWSYPITVAYSGVYVIEENAEKIKDVNVNVEDITTLKIPEAAGLAAKEAMQEYFNLKTADRQLIDEDLILEFARIAAFYVNTVDYVNSINALGDAFTYSPEGAITYVGKNYKAVKDAIAELKNDNSDYNASANLLLKIKEEFGEEQFNSKYKISSLTSAHTPEVAEGISKMLQHILDVYDALSAVPSSWKEFIKTEDYDGFYAYETDVFAAVNKIRQSDYTGPQFSGMYQVITNWRPDFFEIIYSYYYYVAEDGQDKIVKNLWGVIPAPGLLQDFYVMYNNAYSLVSQITNLVKTDPSKAMRGDLYTFHYYYLTALKIADEIKNGDNELYKTVYNAINLDAYIEAYLNAPYSSIFGYYDFVGVGIDNANIQAGINAYYEVLDVYYKTGKIEITDANKRKIEAIFDSMTAMSPAELHWFLSALSFRYHDTRGTVFFLDYNVTPHNLIVDIIASYYITELPKNNPNTTPHKTHTMFLNLLLAMESYSLTLYKDSALEDFKYYMNLIAEDYKLLDGTEEAAFDSLLGDCYKKYFDIKKNIEQQESLTLGDYETKFNELYQTLIEFNDMFAISLDSSNPNQQNSYIMMIALYNKATAIYNELTTAAKTNTAITNALNAKLYVINDDISDTLDKFYFDVSALIIDIMHINGVWHANNNATVRAFTLEILPAMSAEFYGTLYEGDVMALVAAFRALTPAEKYAVYNIQANKLFYAQIDKYFNAQLSEEAKSSAIMTDLLNAEIYYSLYELDSANTEALSIFKSSMEAAIEKYASLSENDKKVIDDVYYNVYLEIYNSLPAEEPEAA